MKVCGLYLEYNIESARAQLWHERLILASASCVSDDYIIVCKDMRASDSLTTLRSVLRYL